MKDVEPTFCKSTGPRDLIRYFGKPLDFGIRTPWMYLCIMICIQFCLNRAILDGNSLLRVIPWVQGDSLCGDLCLGYSLV
jgi:hypothetical protein